MERTEQWQKAKVLAGQARALLIYSDERKAWIHPGTGLLPEWITNLFHACHVMPECQSAVMPNDHVYKAIVLGLDLFDETEDEEQWDEGYQNIEADVYNADLLAWVGSDLEFTAFADQVLAESYNDGLAFFPMLQTAQVEFRQHVLHTLKETLLEQVETNEEAQDGNV